MNDCAVEVHLLAISDMETTLDEVVCLDCLCSLSPCWDAKPAANVTSLSPGDSRTPRSPPAILTLPWSGWLFHRRSSSQHPSATDGTLPVPERIHTNLMVKREGLLMQHCREGSGHIY